MPPALGGEIFILNFFVNDYIEDMVTFTALEKFNARVAGLGEIFVQRKFLAMWYYYGTVMPLVCMYI